MWGGRLLCVPDGHHVGRVPVPAAAAALRVAQQRMLPRQQRLPCTGALLAGWHVCSALLHRRHQLLPVAAPGLCTERPAGAERSGWEAAGVGRIFPEGVRSEQVHAAAGVVWEPWGALLPQHAGPAHQRDGAQQAVQVPALQLQRGRQGRDLLQGEGGGPGLWQQQGGAGVLDRRKKGKDRQGMEKARGKEKVRSGPHIFCGLVCWLEALCTQRTANESRE